MKGHCKRSFMKDGFQKLSFFKNKKMFFLTTILFLKKKDPLENYFFKTIFKER